MPTKYLLTLLALALAWPAPVARAATDNKVRETLLLDGAWQIVADKENLGRRQGWQNAQLLATQPATAIAVPSCWEATLKDYEGVAWYQCHFTPPASWQARHVRLHFGAANYLAEVWLNGEAVGDHEGGYSPFAFDVSAQVRCGVENTLIVRIVGPAVKAEAVDLLVRNEAPHWRGAYAGGLWQSVWLEATAPVFVGDVFVEPKLAAAQAVLHLTLDHAGHTNANVDLEAQISRREQPDAIVARALQPLTIPPGGLPQTLTLNIPDPKPWSPEHPQLYVARVQLASGGKVLDETTVTFGLREFTMQGGDFYLNGQRLFIKGAFWEGFYPNTLAAPSSRELVRQEITLAKQAGLNLLRPWRKPSSPMVTELADELGILLIGSPAIENMGYWPEVTPQYERRWTHEMEQLVLHDRNHPSIIAWETANEIIRKGELLPRHPVSLAARRLDPTRLIFDESGATRAPWGAHAYLPYSTEPQAICDRHIYQRAPVDEATYQELLTAGDANLPTTISEVGYGSWPDLPQNVARYAKEGNPLTADYRFHHELLTSLSKVYREQRLNEIFPDLSRLCLASQQIQAQGNQHQLEALRLNPRADGYCLHAYTDGDWVVGAGVLDLWRQPKAMYAALKAVQQPLYLAIHTAQPNVYADRGVALTITAVNDHAGLDGELVLSAEHNQQTVWSLRQKVRLETGIHALYQGKLDTTGWDGEYTLSARLVNGDQSLSANTYPLLVVRPERCRPPAVEVALIDPKDQLKNFFQAAGKNCPPFGANATGVALVTENDVWLPAKVESYVRLMDWVKRGGVAIWLKPPASPLVEGDPIYRDPENNYMLKLRKARHPATPVHNVLTETGLFPWSLQSRRTKGHWIPVNHYARPRPVFDGLPREGFLGHCYQNVAPMTALMNPPGEELAGCLSWNAEPWDYYPTFEAWHATDLAVAPHGKGFMILSTFQIANHLGTDPVADVLLVNLLKLGHTLLKPLDQPSPDLAAQIQHYQAKCSALWKPAASK